MGKKQREHIVMNEQVLSMKKDMPMVANKLKYGIFTIYSLLFVVFGLAFDSPREIIQGLYRIVIEPDCLITDYIKIGGIGAAFINAGIIMLFTIAILYLLKIEISGNSIAAIYLMGGFALFGKNIFNIWLIILGVVIYAAIKKEKLAQHIHTAFFGTSLAPIISEIFFGLDISVPFKIIFGIIVGLSIGLLLPPLSAYLFNIHKGFNLYNVGFTAGLLGTIYVSIFRSYGFVSYSQLIWSEGNNTLFGIFLTTIMVSMMLMGFMLNGRAFRPILKIFSYSGVAKSDFVLMEDFGTALFNMGLNGLVAMVYVLIVGGALNGPTMGGILTVMCFGAYGKHVKNILPIFLGVFIGSLTKVWNINDPHILLAALFGTGLAPIGGHYGWIYGVIAGFINSSVVLNSGILHGGMNLYNTGFSAGIVAAVMLPVIEAFRRKKDKS
ncbi:MAG: hypothetical protein K0R34_826 [Herbinix sp.]|jgi:hypothetical protein|nr:hypothetical protein [Herbinix sp.]